MSRSERDRPYDPDVSARILNESRRLSERSDTAKDEEKGGEGSSKKGWFGKKDDQRSR